MEKLPFDIEKEYSCELNKISNILNQLKSGRVYEISHAQMDGYLSTNIATLEKELNELLSKIQNCERGFAYKAAEMVSKTFGDNK